VTADMDGGGFSAADPGEFRQLLVEMRLASGLSCGQIAFKTGMARSQVYSLTTHGRIGLPKKPEQLESLGRACGLSEVEVAQLMTLWRTMKSSGCD